MFCPPFATSLPQSENKVASTQSKGLVKDGWKAHGGQERVEGHSFNEKQESKQLQKLKCPKKCLLVRGDSLSKSFWFGSLKGPLSLCDNGGFGFVFVSEKIFFNTFINAKSTVSTFTNNTIEVKVSIYVCIFSGCSADTFWEYNLVISDHKIYP
jgi:hypothetical protein